MYRLPLEAHSMMEGFRSNWATARHKLHEARLAEQQHQAEFLRLYHILERLPPFHVADGYKIAKRLQEVLVLRRQAKWDVHAWVEVVHFMDATQHKMLACAERVERRSNENQRYLAHMSEVGEDAAD
jgi:hypothetical protein